MNIAAKTEQDKKTHEHSIKISKTLTKGDKHIKKPTSIPAKTQQNKKTMSIAMKTKKMHENIKKPMSITTKMKTNQKTHEHSIQKTQTKKT